MKGAFRRYEAYPETRYTIVQAWEPRASTRRPISPSVKATSPRNRASFVAFDTLEKRHVLVTAVRKATASGGQIDHAHRVMQTLSRTTGFQRLLDVWEDEDRAWVFVQDFNMNWMPLDIYFETHMFTEDKLRRATFQVVSMVHFLHSHRLSASGQLCAHQDLVMDANTDNVTWLISPMLVLSGCLLVPETPSRFAKDIAGIGVMMIHLSVLQNAEDFAKVEDLDKLQQMIHDQLQHLTAPCRAIIVSCLTESPSINELIKRKWLRHVDFVSVVPRTDHHPNGHTFIHPQRLELSGLLWKLATFLLLNYNGELHHLGAIQTASSRKEEELESTRQRLRKTAKRAYVGRKVFFTHHHPSIGGGRSGSMLNRGIVIMPPLSSAMLPGAADSEGLDPFEQGTSIVQSRSFYLPNAEKTETEEAIYEVSAQAISTHTSPYDSFVYEFPASPLVKPLPVYDAFDSVNEDNEFFLVESSALENGIVEDGEGRRERTPSLLMHENGHSNGSISSLKKQISRSLLPHSHSSTWEDDQQHSNVPSHYESSYGWAKESMDPVHFSAFGPSDISYRETFRIDIWAYLQQQRREMLENALERNESEVGQRVQPLQLARGTLITICVEPNDRFGITGDDCKSFRWRGEINGVSFDMYRQRSNVKRSEDEEDREEDALCIARIVAGTKVSLLYIRLRASADRGDAGLSTLSTHLEHLTPTVPEILPEALEIVRPIGKGAFGEAVLALWKEQNTHVVIKSPHQNAFGDSETVEAFRHEAAVMQMVGKHPHVVELIGLLSSSSGSALVTEYLPNGSLDSLLARAGALSTSADDVYSEHLSLFSRTVMARDAAHGIINIHQGHILHRDIAARNCLLDVNFRVKVCDFGLSRLSKASMYFDDLDHGFGPVKWMAPESVLPPHLFSTQSDSYMFGVLMYEIFSGSLPFPGISSREAVALILEGAHVPIPQHLPLTHQDLMRQCFDLHPLSRPTMDHIFSTLDRWILHDTRHHTPHPVGIL
ncbi:hypothetical protein Poli38472_008821 [Pythium oligandrum]|uniref:Protein kinase domain-containing protein n=1 Tax=Pythium oligandrum TaxID=41045 RepID=A0A8K1FEU2_PYTOL|nr:hypothetical protein Poli38472_008821 [Pythium oligandrum]|eukprot:TMW56173.1 hypothetical protein Poli38472_008821 [Pythium oligandrum]